MPTDRRTFLQLLTTGAMSAAFPASIAKALSIPANNRTGTIEDVEHIVILMQENRAFDHYFGTLRGVRGYGDPRAVNLPSGDPVWYQPNPSGGYTLPFHPGAPDLGLQFIQDLAHDWTTTHGAWNEGNHDQWVPQKGTTTMAHLNRSDIPFHYALADAFTICDAYHCSLLGPTDPNRYYMWTGWVGNDGKNGGPVIDNAEAGYDWSTYPERLVKAGVSWKIYQDQGEGLNAANSWGWTGDNAYIGNYGDNSLLYFHQYQNSQPGSPLYQAALTGTDILTGGTLFDEFRKDVATNKLPKVSYIVAPEAYTEHPNWPANYGAWYVSQILEALTSNPEVWSKTAFLLTYDENDGFFDHSVPPTVPPSDALGKSTIDTVNEIFEGDSEYPAGPYGMGARVPMIVISPWSKGGYVSSELFDHTSIIRFIEKRFGPHNPELVEPNITPWRRAVSGDLTSAFNFKSPNAAKVPLPSTTAYVPPDNNRHPDYVPVPPTEQALPIQEPGTRPARAVPYELHVRGEADFNAGTFKIHFSNAGKAVVYQVRSGSSSESAPRTYTVGSGAELSDTWNIKGNGQTTYDLSVYGPNGFLRAYRGSVSGTDKANIEIGNVYDKQQNRIIFFAVNRGTETRKLRLTDSYTGDVVTGDFKAGETVEKSWSLNHSHGWYDFTIEDESDASFRYQLAGHVETGEDSMTDPAIAATK
ncbi:phosphocholine-specific phospholipase C [Acidicapsa ligni]|uniref:phosphocholine-specific phospholipase C n=1 Tax=Acidicapsa ligni TaxID=542300 RepID=UPI0021DFB40C|nr:phospholipase C, phosphocholine-specific [Acidicapsa ligni]